MKRKRTYKTLLAWREDIGLTQTEAAQLLGLSQPTYSRLERFQRAPKPKLAKFIATKARVPLESVLGIE